MMIIKNSQLDKNTIESLNILVDLNVPSKIAFKLIRIIKEISSLVEDKLKIEKKILDKYISKDENGNPLPAMDDRGNIIPNAAKITDLDKFNEEMDELNSIETELPFEKINFDDLGLTTVRVRDLIRIEFLFD
jgi:hypothetical protein